MSQNFIVGWEVNEVIFHVLENADLILILWHGIGHDGCHESIREKLTRFKQANLGIFAVTGWIDKSIIF